MLKQISRAGFKGVTADVRLTVTGRLAREGDARWIELDGMNDERRLQVRPRAGDPAIGPALAETALGIPVRIQGYWTGAGTLDAVAIEPASPAQEAAPDSTGAR
jgi:hypothetical protein